MANNEVGAFLNITPDVLNKLDSFDKKLEQIQNHSKTAADALKKGFGSAVIDTTKLENAIASLTNKIGTLNSAGNAVQNIGSSAKDAVAPVQSITTGLSETAQIVNRLSVSRPYQDWNIAGLKAEIDALNASLKSGTVNTENGERALMQREQQAIVDKRNALQEELRIQEASTAAKMSAINKVAKVQNADIALQQKITENNAKESEKRIKQAQREYEERAKLARQSNYTKNTTPQGALAFSNTANTLQRQVQAIEYLKKARLSLNTTDKDYASTLELINRAIAKHNQELQQAGVKSQQLSSQHRNLMDTSGQLKRQLSLLFSVSQIEGYISKLANVRGEFELQQRSLQAILQNKSQADQIFNKTVQLAVKSPFQIKELITYTKQLAAYRIESSKLYDTTKRLADVSAGLGVDMQRLILAYGQVKAAAYLRGCLGYNTPIRMYDGSIKMVQDVQVGDVLINENGEKVNVKELIRGREKMYIINQLCGNDRTMYKVNANHILTLWNVAEQRLEDIYLYDYLKDPEQPYLGVKVQDNGERFYYAIEAIECGVDNYYGFVLDGNKRFLLGDGTITHNTEVRQFTEAGVNLYGELQSYFQEIRGEAYTTAQIVDMISKRKVTFEDIENIFKRLTDKGGLFYNMQEIQADTLRGKIANLKDSIDVMLNSIGKANEGTLKGTIDTVKTLLDNWETVVDVAKAFGAVIGAMGLVAWSKKIGVANANVGLLGVGIKRLTVTLTALKTTFMSSLPTAGIFLAIEALTELIRVNSEYRKAMSESTTNYFKNRVIVSEIDKESESDIKSALSKLIKAMNNEGFEIEIKANISEDEARKEFDNYKQMYENFLYDMLVIEQKYAENKKKGWMIGDDDIDTDAQEYKESLADFIAKGEKIRSVLLQVSEQSKILTKTQVEQFKELASGPDKGENIINYYERLAKALEEVGYKADEAYGGRISKQNILGGYHQTQGMWGVGTELDRQMAGFSTSFITMNRDLEEFKREAISILGEVREDMSDEEKNELKIKIDKTAIEKGWDDVIKDVVYQTYYIDLKVDAYKVEKEMDGLDIIFKKWFSTHTYKLGINYGDLGKKDIFKGFLEQGDEMAAAYKKAELSAKRLKNAADTVFNQKQSGLAKEQFKNAFGMIEFVSKEQLLKYYEELAKANKQAAIDAGWTEDEKKKRDIWAERISVLKEMQSRYEKLNKLMGENRAIEETRSAFKGALDSTNMREVIKAEDIIPTKQGMVDALEKLLKQIPNDVKNAAKRTGLEKEIAELKIGIQQDYLKEQLEKTKENIETMFNGLDLHQKLKDAGLSEAEVQQLFPGLAKTLDDVQKGIEEAYKKNFPKGEYLTPGTESNKKYKEDQEKLNKQRIKESQDLVVKLTKAYKTQLTDQLQLDKWYYEEKAKIAKANLTEEQKTQYNSNLDTEYKKKSDENAWKSFKESDMYISMFENIESSSTRMLEAMRDKLASLREKLKELPADQLKAIVNQQEKIDEMITQKNPFRGLTSGIKEYIKFLKQRKELEEEYIRAGNAVDTYTKQRDIQSKIVQQKQKEYDKEVELHGVGTSTALSLKLQLKYEKEQLETILKKLVAEKKITEETAAQIRNGQKLEKTLGDKFSEIGSGLSEFSSALPQIAENLENVFGTMSAGTSDTISSIAEIAGGLGETATGIGRAIANPADIGGYIQALSGFTKTIGAVFAIGDKKKEREIQRQIKNVENLQKAYEVLKEKMDIAWSSVTLHDMTQQTSQNIDQQIRSYQQMIKSEEAKKKTDKNRIEEWNDAIKELEKTKQEILKQEQMDLGGIGGDTEYKAAAQAFADAWVDAFNESEDGLNALQETFDDYISNLIKKQAMMRLVQARMKSVFEAIDMSVTDSSAGGINLTKEELANIKSLGESALKGLNEDLLALMETLGYKGTSAGQKAELSALTQSIQGITEREAEVLEALLNSIRFFVNQQTTDISAIRAIIEKQYGLSDSGSSNPMLTELKSQTEYLKLMSDNFESILSYSSSSKGRGIRVFMQP